MYGNADIGTMVTNCQNNPNVKDPRVGVTNTNCPAPSHLSAYAGLADARLSGCPTGGCSQWNIAGTWQMNQSNNYSPMLTLQLNGTTVTRTSLSPGDRAKGNYVSNSSTVTGTLNGDQLQFTTSQMAKLDGSASQGQFSGTVSEGQITDGTGPRSAASGTTATWTATGPGDCADRQLRQRVAGRAIGAPRIRSRTSC